MGAQERFESLIDEEYGELPNTILLSLAQMPKHQSRTDQHLGWMKSNQKSPSRMYSH